MTDNHVVIDGQDYALIRGKISNASPDEDGDQVNPDRSWSMELVFPDNASHLEPAHMKVLETTVTLDGVTYKGKATVRSMEIKYDYEEGTSNLLGRRAFAVFAGIGPLVIDPTPL